MDIVARAVRAVPRFGHLISAHRKILPSNILHSVGLRMPIYSLVPFTSCTSLSFPRLPYSTNIPYTIVLRVLGFAPLPPLSPFSQSRRSSLVSTFLSWSSSPYVPGSSISSLTSTGSGWSMSPSLLRGSPASWTGADLFFLLGSFLHSATVCHMATNTCLSVTSHPPRRSMTSNGT